MEIDIQFPLNRVASTASNIGSAVCICKDFVVVTEIQPTCVAVYDLRTLKLVSRFGKKGSGVNEFEFDWAYSGVCAGVGTGATVFVADAGNARVSEHVLPGGGCVRLLGLTHLESPRGVDAHNRHIVVSDVGVGLSRVLLFASDAQNFTPPLRVFGDAHGRLLHRLYHPLGLRICRGDDDSAVTVFVTDSRNHRVVRIRFDGTGTGTDVAVVASWTLHGLHNPSDVLQCTTDQLLIANSARHALVKVWSCGMVETSGDRKFDFPSGLAFCPLNDLLVVRGAYRLQLYHVEWARLRAAWLAACALY